MTAKKRVVKVKSPSKGEIALDKLTHEVFLSGCRTGEIAGRAYAVEEYKKTLPQLSEQQRREAQAAMVELSKAMTKMAYNLMMITNGGKPFGGS